MDGVSYRVYLKENGLKFMPDFLIPAIKPKIIGDITKNKKIVGKVIGVHTKTTLKLDQKHRDAYIQGIINLKTDDDTKIFIDDFRNFEPDFLCDIQEKTGLIFNSGDNIRILNIPLLLKEVYNNLEKDPNVVDTLIICSEKERLLKVVGLLSEAINFFTVIGLEYNIKDIVYDEVLQGTGVSIFQPAGIQKIIKNYGTIINFMDDIDFDINAIRNQAVIIDFSKAKPFKKLEKTKKGIILIEDINLEVNSYTNLKDNLVSPELFESLSEEMGEFRQIYTNNDYYFINDLVIREIIRVRRI